MFSNGLEFFNCLKSGIKYSPILLFLFITQNVTIINQKSELLGHKHQHFFASDWLKSRILMIFRPGQILKAYSPGEGTHPHPSVHPCHDNVLEVVSATTTASSFIA